MNDRLKFRLFVTKNEAYPDKVGYAKEESFNELLEENENLKELLRECKDVIKDVDTYCTKNADEGYILTYKIDNAIGEKK